MYFSLLSLLVWCIENHVSCHGRDIKRRNESTNSVNNCDDASNRSLIFVKIDTFKPVGMIRPSGNIQESLHSILKLLIVFPFQMATLRNGKKW